MARTYRRDSRGRFAGGGGGSSRPAARGVSRGTNRLTRDNAGRITGTGNGTTARGGRIRTAAGGLRGMQTARLKGAGGKLRGGKAGAGAKVAKVAKPVAQAQVARAARIADRLAANIARSQKPAKSQKAMAKRARSAAVAQLASQFLSARAVGKRNPNVQYSRAQLMDGLGKSISRPLPKSSRKSTAKGRKGSQERSDRDFMASMILRNRRRR